MFRLLSAITTFCLVSSAAMGIGYTGGGIAHSWGLNTSGSGSPGNFVINGCVGRGCPHGSWDDEWAVVAIIANKIVAHGGYFCPYQIQCANHNNYQSWTVYYHPPIKDNWDDWGAHCKWLCEPGYSGVNCEPQKESPAYCDNTYTDRSTNGIWNGVGLRTDGKNNYPAEAEVIGFGTWGIGSIETDFVLGVIKFLDHGVVAAPMAVKCGCAQKKCKETFVNAVWRAAAKGKVLCSVGYKLNAAGDDCVPIDLNMCGIDSMRTCTHWTKEGFDAGKHELVESNGCAKYFCVDKTKAFPATGDFACEPCGVQGRDGPDPETGVCRNCQTGQFFNRETGTCETAKAWTTTDLIYGKGGTKNTTEIKDQCWIYASPEEYANCMNQVKTTTGGNVEEEKE